MFFLWESLEDFFRNF